MDSSIEALPGDTSSQSISLGPNGQGGGGIFPPDHTLFQIVPHIFDNNIQCYMEANVTANNFEN